METIFVSLISIILIIASSMTLTINWMKSTDKVATSWRQMVTQSLEISKTSITALPPQSYHDGVLEISVANNGQISLSDFSKWDVIVEYESGESTYLSYSSGQVPEENRWFVSGILSSNNRPEIFNPNVLDPGEQLVINFIPSEDLLVGQSCRITVSTQNGVKTQVDVARE
ncbi:MAG TPA: hypothetical protein VEH58_02710 [Dehalococcoidales bacterium]|nr:hypothetical protein [Dehalococcoidales bacterium]